MKTHTALKRYFDRKRESSPGYSMRSLARRLNVSPSFISRVLNGKKPIPSGLKIKLAEALDVEPELMGPDAAEPSPARDEVPESFDEWSIMSQKTHRILRNWYYLPILELLTLTNFDGTLGSIARRLKLSETTTAIAVRELESLGLLKFADGRYEKTDKKIRFTSAKSTPLIRRYHEEMLERGKEELRTATADADFQRRLITGITLTATPEKVQAAKAKLAQCLYEIANDLTESPGTEVYQLSAQLFPITKGE